MLYASCKSAFVSGLGSFGVDSEKMLSVEVDSPAEVAPDALYKDIHPETIPVKKVRTPFNPSARTFQDFETTESKKARPCCAIQWDGIFLIVILIDDFSFLCKSPNKKGP